MDLERQRRAAVELFERLGAGDVDGGLALLHDDVEWWIAGKPGAVPSAGPHDKAWMAALFRRMHARLRDGLRMTVGGTTAEGDRVAVELRSHGELRDGRVYANEYHVLVTFRGEKIAAVREYLDTQHVVDVWFAPGPAAPTS